MYYVYALLGESGKIYIGYSHNLKARIRKHLLKGVYTTKRYGELRLIFYEAFINKLDAQKREAYLKTTKGKRTLKFMLVNYFKVKNQEGPIV